ncbi:TPA: hypothetical protein DCX16_05100 [bacterium]|nr:hypothetical protein [bacterium]
MERIVVVSDLHLGEEYSSLKDKMILNEFVNELRGLGPIDQFVLIGDILDLSMASFHEAVVDGKILFEALSNIDIKEIVYVPGNHDHHIWVLEVEYRDIVQTIKNGNDPPSSPDYIRELKGNDSFISWIFPSSMRDRLTVKYPNHKAEIKEKNYFFHHGHYLSTEGGLLCGVDEAIEKNFPLNEFELHNSPIHELIQYQLEQSPIMQKK